MTEKNLTSYSEHYFEISKDNFIKFLKLSEDYNKIWERIEYLSKKFEDEGDEEDSKELDLIINEAAEIKNDRDAAGHITIIFSAMCLEAIINHYAINRSSKSYFDNYLDKLDFKSKWIIFPKLLSSAEFNCDSQAFEFLKKVITLRNELVHYKSRVIKFNQNMNGEMKKSELDFRSDVQNSLKAIFLVVEELKRIDPNWKEHIWYTLSQLENPDIIKFIK